MKVEQLASGPDDTTSMVSAEQLLPGTQYAQVLTMHSVIVLDISLTPFFFLLLCSENEPQMHTRPTHRGTVLLCYWDLLFSLSLLSMLNVPFFLLARYNRPPVFLVL